MQNEYDSTKEVLFKDGYVDINIMHSNECNLCRNFNGGVYYINYRNANNAITEYRFCDGKGSVLFSVNSTGLHI